MDWIMQRNFKNWLIGVLLVSNFLTVSIVWMRTGRTADPEPKGPQPRGSESVQLMRKALGLNEEQTRHLETLRNMRAEQSRIYNDRLAILKRQLAEEVFKEVPDTNLARTQAKEIGELQANVEIVRFEYFNELLVLCTPEQRQKLKPIVVEVFGRKPPKDESGGNPQGGDSEKEKNPPDRRPGDPPGDGAPDRPGRGAPKDGPPNRPERGGPRDDSPDRPSRETERDGASDREGEKPQPPSPDERLEKYSERLNLTDVQRREIRSIMLVASQKGEQLRRRPGADRSEVEAEKERIRKEEDEGIMKLLDSTQKEEFVKMLSRRKN